MKTPSKVTWGDLIDFPIVLLPVALLLRMALDAKLSRTPGLFAAVLLLLLLFAQGHAIHLAANAIAHNFTKTDAAWQTACFLDENVGHYELHIALLAPIVPAAPARDPVTSTLDPRLRLAPGCGRHRRPDRAPRTTWLTSAGLIRHLAIRPAQQRVRHLLYRVFCRLLSGPRSSTAWSTAAGLRSSNSSTG